MRPTTLPWLPDGHGSRAKKVLVHKHINRLSHTRMHAQTRVQLCHDCRTVVTFKSKDCSAIHARAYAQTYSHNELFTGLVNGCVLTGFGAGAFVFNLVGTRCCREIIVGVGRWIGLVLDIISTHTMRELCVCVCVCVYMVVAVLTHTHTHARTHAHTHARTHAQLG